MQKLSKVFFVLLVAVLLNCYHGILDSFFACCLMAFLITLMHYGEIVAREVISDKFFKKQIDIPLVKEEIKEAAKDEVVEVIITNHTSTPSYYLNNETRSLAKVYGKTSLGRIPPVPEIAKFTLLGAKEVYGAGAFVEFDSNLGDYHLFIVNGTEANKK